jgi:hypothetical protein
MHYISVDVSHLKIWTSWIIFTKYGADDGDHATKIQGTQSTSNLKHLQSHVT